MGKQKVFIIPSSDDERLFDNCNSYNQAIKINTDNCCSGSEHIFSTKEERDSFIQGYLAGIGYLGEGIFFTS